MEDFKEALPMLLEDGSFLLMAIVTIAFHDKTKILIATQLLFALIQYMSVRRKGQGGRLSSEIPRRYCRLFCWEVPC